MIFANKIKGRVIHMYEMLRPYLSANCFFFLFKCFLKQKTYFQMSADGMRD